MVRKVKLRRHIRDLPPSYPEAVVMLVDALREYLRSEDELTKDLQLEGAITRAQADTWWKGDRKPFADMLAELEQRSFDPSLHGLIKKRR